jgi:hypothetical protein
MFHQNEQNENFITPFNVDGPISTIFNQNPLGSFEHETTCKQMSTSSVFHVHFTQFVQKIHKNIYAVAFLL